MTRTVAADQFFEIAFHDLWKVLDGQIGAMIRDPVLGKIIGANAFVAFPGAYL